MAIAKKKTAQIMVNILASRIICCGSSVTALELIIISIIGVAPLRKLAATTRAMTQFMTTEGTNNTWNVLVARFVMPHKIMTP